MRKTAIGIILGVTAVLGGCTRAPSDAANPPLRLALLEEVRTLDPVLAQDDSTLSIVPLIFEPLFEYGYLSEPLTVQPLLAADLPRFSADGLSATIVLTPGISIHPQETVTSAPQKPETHSRTLTAADVVYSLKRLALPGVQCSAREIFARKVKGFRELQEKLAATPSPNLALLDEPLDGIQAQGSDQIVFRLITPFPRLTAVLSSTQTAIVPRSESIAPSGFLKNKFLGTGPYVLSNWTQGRSLELTRFPDFHPNFYPSQGAPDFVRTGLLGDSSKPLPFIDRVQFDHYPSDAKEWNGFLDGALEVLSIPHDRFSEAIRNQSNLAPDLAEKGIRLAISSPTRIYYLSLNLADPVLGKNKKLRQALSAAIHREAWVEIINSGQGVPAKSLLSPETTRELKYGYSIDHAKKLLKEAGFAGDKGIPSIRLDMRGTDRLNHQLADFLVSQWKAVGIQVQPAFNTSAEFQEKLKNGTLQISYGGWGLEFADPEDVLKLFVSDSTGRKDSALWHETHFDQPRYNKLFDQVSSLPAGNARRELMEQMDDLIQEECPWILGYFEQTYRLAQPWLQNFRSHDLLPAYPKYVKISIEQRQRYLQQRKTTPVTAKPSPPSSHSGR